MIDQIFDTFIKAGHVIVFIFAVCVYAWFLIFQKIVLIKKELASSRIIVEQEIKTLNTASFTFNTGFETSVKLLAADRDNIEAVAEENRTHYFEILERNSGTIATLAAIAPLLGLLGTVTGMMTTFSMIKLFGSSNPVLMADGISEALLTTQAGLVVAFPIVLANTFLKNRIKEIKDNFEKVYIKLRGFNV